MSLLLQKKKLLHHLRRKCFLLRWCWVRVFLCSQKVLGETHNWPGTPCREMLPVLVPTWINNYLHESWRGIVCFIFVFYLHVGVTTLTNVQADTYADSLTYIHNHRKGFLNALCVWTQLSTLTSVSQAGCHRRQSITACSAVPVFDTALYWPSLSQHNFSR